MLRCESCSVYNLTQICRVCGSRASNPKPPKYSVEDRYAKYRRMAREQEE